jgi:4-hydroxyphenylacetate 3-monooxygenase/4-hydroxybutyryl-CoA dehydratase/vinylacetyl-CoA-Delta-isomerase
MKIYHEHETLADLAGGLAATLPHNDEFLDPVTGPFLRKYLARKAGVSAEHIYRCYNLISDMICSGLGGVYQIAGLHGGGSPIMEAIAIMSQYDVEARKRLVKALAGIPAE